MTSTPCIILVVMNGVERNARLVFDAMAAGALDAVDMPEPSGAGLDHVLHKMRSLARLLQRKPRHRGRDVANAASDLRSEFALAHDKPLLIAIGASTGGPAALKTILSDLPKDFAAAVVVAQHLDEEFAAMMAGWLSQESALPVAVAQRGERPTVGNVLVAGTNEHMVLTENGALSYCNEPTELAYRPSVDELFASAALYWQGPIVGVLLTGMGDDGAKGLLALRRLGHYTIVQDEASCVVYGMPKAAVKLGAAIQQLPLSKIGRALVQLVKQHKYQSRGD
jgi:chemotaxis response regulator CheB